MKKIFLTTAIAALLSVNVFATAPVVKVTEDGTENVSYAAINKFNADFTRAKNVTWKVNSNFQKATFTLDDVKMSAFYDAKGELIGVTQNVQFKALPEKAKKQIGEKYAGYFANEVIKLETGADNSYESTVYFVDLKKDNDEFLVRVTPASEVFYFQKVK